jgi:hypothetical protein
VGDRSIAALEQRADKNGDHLLAFDSQARSPELYRSGKYMLGFQEIRPKTENLGDIRHPAGVMHHALLIDFFDFPGRFRLIDGFNKGHCLHSPFYGQRTLQTVLLKPLH